jgi:hypothetical protein
MPNKRGGKTAKEMREEAAQASAAMEAMIELQKKELAGLSQIYNVRSQYFELVSEEAKLQEKKSSLEDQYRQNFRKTSKASTDAIKNDIVLLDKEIGKLKTMQTILKNGQGNVNNGLRIPRINDIDKFTEFLKLFNDKPIRETILQLGLGAERGQLIRDSFYESLPAVSLLGSSMKELAIQQQIFSDQTGRATILTGEQQVNIAEIARGTGLGVQNASRLVAQFEMLGINVEKSHETIQSIMDSTERMGINTTKVLKNIAANFKALNTFAFRDGIKGMTKLAQYAEKFKVSMTDALNSAEIARSLEGAIDLAAHLQILGGEFAKADPFEMLFLSRNDPAGYTKKINDLTKGMHQLTKTADGFQISASPMDLDRLREAAKALNIPFENLVQQSQRMAENQAMLKQLGGSMFNKKDVELWQSLIPIPEYLKSLVKVFPI